MMTEMKIRTFVESDTESVINLWSSCGLLRPWNDPAKDISRKLQVQRDMFVVGEMSGRIVAVMMVEYDGHRGWVNYLAIEPALQRQGLGRQMMTEAERMLTERGCPKLNIQVQGGNSAVMSFYKRLGYVVDDVVSLGKRLIKDDGA